MGGGGVGGGGRGRWRPWAVVAVGGDGRGRWQLGCRGLSDGKARKMAE